MVHLYRNSILYSLVLVHLIFASGLFQIYAPTGPLNRDYDDVRRFADAAVSGIKR